MLTQLQSLNERGGICEILKRIPCTPFGVTMVADINTVMATMFTNSCMMATNLSVLIYRSIFRVTVLLDE